jgi:hypothetical protein
MDEALVLSYPFSIFLFAGAAAAESGFSVLNPTNRNGISNHFTYAMTYLFNKNTYAMRQYYIKNTYAMRRLLKIHPKFLLLQPSRCWKQCLISIFRCRWAGWNIWQFIPVRLQNIF